jgi:hypothetical protein
VGLGATRGEDLVHQLAEAVSTELRAFHHRPTANGIGSHSLQASPCAPRPNRWCCSRTTACCPSRRNAHRGSPSSARSPTPCTRTGTAAPCPTGSASAPCCARRPVKAAATSSPRRAPSGPRCVPARRATRWAGPRSTSPGGETVS